MLSRWEEIRRRRLPAAAAAATEGVNVFVDEVERKAPRDTNRYVRGWQIAANQVNRSAGVSTRAVLQVKRSSRHGDYINALVRQAGTLKSIIDWRKKRIEMWYDQQGRSRGGSWVQRELGKIRTLERRLGRALEELKKATDDPFILYFGGKLQENGPLHRDIKRQVSTVRTKLYGGEGRIVGGSEGSVYVQLINKEPHARIVEKKYQVRKRAAAAAKAAGARAVSRRFVRGLAGMK